MLLRDLSAVLKLYCLSENEGIKGVDKYKFISGCTLQVADKHGE